MIELSLLGMIFTSISRSMIQNIQIGDWNWLIGIIINKVGIRNAWHSYGCFYFFIVSDHQNVLDIKLQEVQSYLLVGKSDFEFKKTTYISTEPSVSHLQSSRRGE